MKGQISPQMTGMPVSPTPASVAELEDLLSTPRPETVRALASCPGDVLVLGAGGKMGPTLARMAARAGRGRVTAVSRFGSAEAARALRDAGVETVSCDLLDRDAVRRLPDAPNIVFMAGQKFGTTGAPSRTWMMNVVVPAICAERYRDSRIVAFSTGNVYPLTAASSRGSSESDVPAPVGEYAASCLGRERVFEDAAERGTRVSVVRLNYAVDLRYGVLTDLAQKIVAGQPVSLAMGRVNVIWQGDANRFALELLALAASPPLVMNVTGTESLAVRWLATELGARLGVAPTFEAAEAADALLSDTTRMQKLLGAPAVSITTLLDWTADWVKAGRPTLNKPTHFGVRDGRF